MNKRYEIRIVGTGPASTGNADTDADLLLQAFLQTLKSNGHQTEAVSITVNGLRIVLEGGKPAQTPVPPQPVPVDADQAVMAKLTAIHADVRKLLSGREQTTATPDTAPTPKPAAKKRGRAAANAPQPGNDGNLNPLEPQDLLPNGQQPEAKEPEAKEPEEQEPGEPPAQDTPQA